MHCIFLGVCLQASLREKIADAKLELSNNSSDETEGEGCRGFEDQEGTGENEDGSNEGCEDTVGSETEILNDSKRKMVHRKRPEVDVNVKEQDSDSINSPEMHVLKGSLSTGGTANTEISAGSELYQKMPEVALAAMGSGCTDSCKSEIPLELPDSSLKQTQVSRDETISAMQTPAVSSATAQPAKRKVRTVGTNGGCY
jgi:hypothetical protein